MCLPSVTWDLVALTTPNTNRNMVQIAVLKIFRRFEFRAEKIENAQWGWHKNFVRCLRNRADGRWRKLICRVSSYNNGSCPFHNLPQPSVDRFRPFLPNVYKPDLLAKVSIEAIAAESPKERHIYSVHVWLPSVYILPRWIQSMITYLGWMYLPSVTWSSVALATPNANSNKVQAAVLIISRRFKFSTDTVEIFSDVEIRLNQLDPAEYVNAAITKNETLWSVNETAQAVFIRLLISSAIYWIRHD